MNSLPASAANDIQPNFVESHSVEPYSGEPQSVQHEPATVFMRFDLPPLPITIRALQERDVRLLEWHGGPDLRSFYEWQWREHHLGQRDVLVAVFNGAPVGQVAIQWRDKPSHPHIPDIQSLRVHDIFRGLGIGSRLLAACELDATQRGHTQIGISVGVDNIGARRLYERHGYHAGGQAYEDSWDYIDARGERVLMREFVLDLIKTLPGRSAPSAVFNSQHPAPESGSHGAS